MYFLLLTLSSSITVTTWWEGLTFLGWYKGSKITRSKNFLWQCSSLIMSSASPFYHDYIYMSSLVYGSIPLLISNILILPTAHLTLIPWIVLLIICLVMTELILILRRREMQLTATNTEHKRFSLCPLLFSLSLSPFWISFKRFWKWGLTMGREEAEPPLLLWDRNTLLITWHVKETFVPGFLALQTAAVTAAAVTEATWYQFWMPPACHLLSRQVWWTRLLNWGYFEGDCLFWRDVDGKNCWCAPLATDL